MKKNKLLLALLTCAAISLSGCDDVKGYGNHNIGLGCYTYEYIHIQIAGTHNCYHDKVLRWANDDGGIEIKGAAHGYVIIGDGAFVLWSDEIQGSICPLCGIDIKDNYGTMAMPTV